MPVDPSTAQAAIDKIKSMYGASSVHPGSDKPSMARFSTGNVELDYMMGGGVPIGRWLHLWGEWSSGKSLTCWQMIREAQAIDKLCAYYNVEKQFIPDFVARQGVDLDKLILVEGSTIEEIGTKLEGLMGSVHVHIIDSLASAVSIDELNAKVEDWQIGLAARAWGKVFRRANERFDDLENVVIMVNQVRSAFGGMADAPPGGRMIDFISSMTIQFRRAGWLFRDDGGSLRPDAPARASLSGEKEPDGIEFVARVQKSRVSTPFRTARLRYDFETGYDENYTLSKAARHFGVVKKTSPKSSYYELPKGGKAQGEAQLAKAIGDDPALAEQIREAVRAAA